MDVSKVRNLIGIAQKITVLTGAGISTDSGIPDFRGPDGVWTLNPEEEKLSTLSNFLSNDEVRYNSWKRWSESSLVDAEPNEGHKALVELEKQKKLQAIITQNVDGLHVKAGNDPGIVYELHGTINTASCYTCKKKFAPASIVERMDNGEWDPRCECGGIPKIDVVYFEEDLPEDLWLKSMNRTFGCELFLAIGTSLQVMPCADLPLIAREYGATVVTINAEPTHIDDKVHYHLNGSISEILPQLI